jgi:hypothetical protein
MMTGLPSVSDEVSVEMDLKTKEPQLRMRFDKALVVFALAPGMLKEIASDIVALK